MLPLSGLGFTHVIEPIGFGRRKANEAPPLPRRRLLSISPATQEREERRLSRYTAEEAPPVPRTSDHPLRSAGEKERRFWGSSTDEGSSRAFWIRAIDSSRLSSISSLLNLNTNQPRSRNHLSRSRSAAISSWAPPSNSMMSFLVRHAKSGMKGPTGSCRRNLTPSRPRRSSDHNIRSALVGSFRMSRAKVLSLLSRRAMSWLYQERRSDTRPLVLKHPHCLVEDSSDVAVEI